MNENFPYENVLTLAEQEREGKFSNGTIVDPNSIPPEVLFLLNNRIEKLLELKAVWEKMAGDPPRVRRQTITQMFERLNIFG